MRRNYFLINLILLIIVGLLGVRFYRVYTHKLNIPAGPEAKQIQKETAPVKGEEEILSASSFEIIVNKDLFRPARSPFKEDVAQPSLPKIPPRLFGTVILGNEKTAILEDPNTKSTRIYRINDSIGGYVVSDIREDKVILLWNGEKSEVRLRDEKKGLPPVKPMMVQQPQQQAPQQPQSQPQQPQIQPQVPQQPAPRPVPPQRPVPQRPVPQRPVPPAN